MRKIVLLLILSILPLAGLQGMEKKKSEKKTCHKACIATGKNLKKLLKAIGKIIKESYEEKQKRDMQLIDVVKNYPHLAPLLRGI